MTDDRAEIEQLYREYWRCMIEKDADGLRGDFTLRKESGAWKLTSSEASTY